MAKTIKHEKKEEKKPKRPLKTEKHQPKYMRG